MVVGDLVWAYDAATNTTRLFTVTAVLIHSDPGQVHLTIDEETLETTPAHPFFTQEQGWVAAGELWIGTHIRRLDGSIGSVRGHWVEAEGQVMYNLTVAGAHTFFVGKDGWLVHNAGPCWLGNNIRETGVLDSSRLRGYQRATSDLTGGLQGATDTFESLTGRKPTIGDITSRTPTDTYIEPGHIEVAFRPNSSSGTPVLEIIDHGAKTYERVHFNP